MQRYQSGGALLRVQLLALVHAQADALGPQPIELLARIAHVGAGGVAEGVTAAAIALGEHVAQGHGRRIRSDELADAVAAIGFQSVHRLDFPDSGWHEDASVVPHGTFARMDLDAAAAALAAVIVMERPHVLVTYPEHGGYPHPDHIMTHLVSMRALELAAPEWPVAKVYAAHTFLHERVVALHEAVLAAELESPYHEWVASGLRPDVVPHARIRCADTFARRDAALRAHASQVDPDGRWFAVPRDIEREAYPYEAYELLWSFVATSVPEDDLFAGLDVAAWDAGTSARPSR